jgi:hypothetical protein
LLAGLASQLAWLAALLARRQSATQQYRWRSPLRWSGTKNSPHDMHLHCPALAIAAPPRTVERDDHRDRTLVGKQSEEDGRRS